MLSEIQAMQNPALGAALVWRFACGFAPRKSTHGVPLPLLFIVLPITLRMDFAEEIAGTQRSSGLRKFEEKFRNRADALLAIQPRVLAMRALSWRSVKVALGTGLLTLVPQEAMVWPRTYSRVPNSPKRVELLLDAAEKLGGWCSDITMFEVARILKVEF